jgi:hypothetical protein
MHFNISEGFQQTFHSNLPGTNVHFLISTFESYIISTFESYNVLEISFVHCIHVFCFTFNVCD